MFEFNLIVLIEEVEYKTYILMLNIFHWKYSL